MTTLQFAPWSSEVDLAFYSALASQKVDHDGLDDAPKVVYGRYEVRPSEAPERSTRINIPGNAFATAESLPSNQYRAEGIVQNTNTIEAYRALDRTAILERAGRRIWDAITDGSVLKSPSLLASFHAIFFADLKKYKFTYHFAFPALLTSPAWKLRSEQPKLSAVEVRALQDSFEQWKSGTDAHQHGFFLAKRSDAQSWTIGALSDYENGFFKDVGPRDRFLCVVDPSTHAQGPAWPARNLLLLANARWQLQAVQLLCYRESQAHRESPATVVFDLTTESNTYESKSEMPKVTGWERNEQDRLNSRTVNLAEYLDPKRIADQAVDLNLKLMKWRIAPGLNLDIIRQTKCLLLGAGTLGSYVSRNLMGWGVRKITFVDNGKVSYSNPVRQPLFNFADCKNGGVDKAIRAAESLREIYPGVEAEGHAISVPMAGHPMIDEAAVKRDFETLERLVDEHDVVLLLMDTRESRWLPTVMGKVKGKIVLNAALGFDTYVVMRHGMLEAPDSKEDQTLGCYFCNDVVAPADSLKDQTLDQQCTVTRPGIAAIASALLVELLVSVLQHPSKGHAPAPSSRNDSAALQSNVLGLVPHQIRGFLSTFDNALIRGRNYDCCSACSDKVLDAYREDSWGFVKRALNEAGYVEELSGLAEVQRRAEEAAKQLELEDEDYEDELEDLDAEGELV